MTTLALVMYWCCWHRLAELRELNDSLEQAALTSLQVAASGSGGRRITLGGLPAPPPMFTPHTAPPTPTATRHADYTLSKIQCNIFVLYSCPAHHHHHHHLFPIVHFFKGVAGSSWNNKSTILHRNERVAIHTHKILSSSHRFLRPFHNLSTAAGMLPLGSQ